MPGAKALDIPGRDHMLAVGDKVFKAGGRWISWRSGHDVSSAATTMWPLTLILSAKWPTVLRPSAGSIGRPLVS